MHISADFLVPYLFEIMACISLRTCRNRISGKFDCKISDMTPRQFTRAQRASHLNITKRPTPLRMSYPSMEKHLKHLEEEKLQFSVSTHREGWTSATRLGYEASKS